MLTASPRLVEFVASFEGFRPQMYNDPANHATIGFGHLIHTGPINGNEPAAFTQSITRDQALALLRDDLKNAESIVTRLVSVSLRQHQFDSLVSFAFNIGRGNFGDSDLLARLNQDEFNAVPGEMNRWIFGNGQRLEGLVRRREREGRLFSKGQYTDEFVYTNQDIINAFAKAESALGREQWSLLTKSGLDVFHLAEDRRGPFSDAAIDTALGRLSAEERRAVQERLPDGRDIPPTDGYVWLREVPLLQDCPLAPPPFMRIEIPSDATPQGKRMGHFWNRYGWVLDGIADYYAIDMEWVLAILAVSGGVRTVSSAGQMPLYFDLDAFWRTWGQHHAEEWSEFFESSGSTTRWRTATTEPWQKVTSAQTTQWSLFMIARHLDKHTALRIVQMGIGGIPGALYRQIGYASPPEMYNAFNKSDHAQLLGWFDFIAGPYGTARRLHALHDRDIAAFAALHYGTDRAAEYKTRLNDAAEWWRIRRVALSNT